MIEVLNLVIMTFFVNSQNSYLLGHNNIHNHIKIIIVHHKINVLH